MLPPYDFGGRGLTLHLAHANGFPPAAYRPLAEALTDRYRVLALPARPLWPGSHPQSAPTWHPLTDDLLHGLEGLGDDPVIGVGHSLGGVVTLWAAVRCPERFRAVALMDPVILPPAWLGLVRLLRLLGVERRLPLVRRALRRRRTWPSRQACFEEYRRKSFFAGWPEESLRAYVEAGTRERNDGSVELVYPPEWEAHIFATTPTDVWRAVPRLSVPALFLRGAYSNTFRPASQARVQRCLPQARCAVIGDAGHMLPFERPAQTARAIRDFLAGLGGG